MTPRNLALVTGWLAETFIKTRLKREREKHDFEIVGIPVDCSGGDVRREV